MYLQLEDIAGSFGTTVDNFNDSFIALYESTNWSYTKLEGADKDKKIIDCLEFVKQDKQIIASPIRTTEWESGWKENLDRYKISNNIEDIIPRFIRSNRPVRYKKEFIIPKDPSFELNYIKLIQRWFFSTYMHSYSSIHEFGCGSGMHLVTLSNLFPNKKLFGYDFSPSSVDLVNTLSRTTATNITGILFDMCNPSNVTHIDENACCFTFGSIEQLAGKFHNFLDFIMQKKPGICFHIEPTIELYDPTNLVDYTAICFHNNRGFTVGFLPYLQELDKQNIIKLIKVNRLQFGNLHMEGYTQIMWSPI